MRTRLGAVVLAVMCAGLAGHAGRVWAAAEVHRFNLVISAIPTQLEARDYNNRLDIFNKTYLDPGGLEGMDEIRFAWLFDSELRYFIRQNIAISAGVGQLRKQSSREFLPTIDSDIQLRAEILSVPIHVGGAYYFQPYNQGDFQARAYLGGGLMSLVYNRARMHIVAVAQDTLGIVPERLEVSGRGDGPGYYVEAGVHMFFASRFSVLLGGRYRSATVRNLSGVIEDQTGEVLRVARLSDVDPLLPFGGLSVLDTSGAGVRMAIAIGF